LARPGVELKSNTGPRLSDGALEFFGLGPGFAISSHLTLSGLQLGCSWKRIAAAPATWGAANEVPLIDA
jgi:hypothetical protein